MEALPGDVVRLLIDILERAHGEGWALASACRRHRALAQADADLWRRVDTQQARRQAAALVRTLTLLVLEAVQNRVGASCATAGAWWVLHVQLEHRMLGASYWIDTDGRCRCQWSDGAHIWIGTCDIVRGRLEALLRRDLASGAAREPYTYAVDAGIESLALGLHCATVQRLFPIGAYLSLAEVGERWRRAPPATQQAIRDWVEGCRQRTRPR